MTINNRRPVFLIKNGSEILTSDKVTTAAWSGYARFRRVVDANYWLLLLVLLMNQTLTTMLNIALCAHGSWYFGTFYLGGYSLNPVPYI